MPAVGAAAVRYDVQGRTVQWDWTDAYLGTRLEEDVRNPFDRIHGYRTDFAGRAERDGVRKIPYEISKGGRQEVKLPDGRPQDLDFLRHGIVGHSAIRSPPVRVGPNRERRFGGVADPLAECSEWKQKTQQKRPGNQPRKQVLHRNPRLLVPCGARVQGREK